MRRGIAPLVSQLSKSAGSTEAAGVAHRTLNRLVSLA